MRICTLAGVLLLTSATAFAQPGDGGGDPGSSIQRPETEHAFVVRTPSAGAFAPHVVSAAVLVIAQSTLIGGLLMTRSRRRQAEADLLKNQIELRQSYERIRDLGSRLLNAQETERSRVARDLHDDISQQMALLEIDLEQLAGVANGEAKTLMKDTLLRAQEIGRSVHDLSHRLHPAKLRLIGLVSALQGLRRELSHQAIEITFNHKNIPANIPEELALCLFRIVQEALHNALKYSQGRHVTVDLRGGGSGLALTVTDDGVGFDVNTNWRKGLGLISMQERLEAVGGSLKIHSTPGAGTRLEVAVPLRLDPEVAACKNTCAEFALAGRKYDCYRRLSAN